MILISQNLFYRLLKGGNALDRYILYERETLSRFKKIGHALQSSATCTKRTKCTNDTWLGQKSQVCALIPRGNPNSWGIFALSRVFRQTFVVKSLEIPVVCAQISLTSWGTCIIDSGPPLIQGSGSKKVTDSILKFSKKHLVLKGQIYSIGPCCEKGTWKITPLGVERMLKEGSAWTPQSSEYLAYVPIEDDELK